MPTVAGNMKPDSNSTNTALSTSPSFQHLWSLASMCSAKHVFRLFIATPLQLMCFHHRYTK